MDPSHLALSEQSSCATRDKKNVIVTSRRYVVQLPFQEEVEVIKETAEATDSSFWEQLLRHHYEQQQEDVARSLGKGKRVRKQVNYNDAMGNDEQAWNNNLSELDSDFSDKEDDEDDDFEHGADASKRDLKRNRNRGSDRERALPPLLARVNGQIEVRSKFQIYFIFYISY